MAKENSRETIIREALKLFAEKGFAAVSMRDLAEAVGISASTIYHYYDSKQALFRDMIREANELTGKARDSFFRILADTEKVECEPFVRAGVMFVTAYLRNERIDPLVAIVERIQEIFTGGRLITADRVGDLDVTLVEGSHPEGAPLCDFDELIVNSRFLGVVNVHTRFEVPRDPNRLKGSA